MIFERLPVGALVRQRYQANAPVRIVLEDTGCGDLIDVYCSGDQRHRRMFRWAVEVLATPTEESLRVADTARIILS